MTDSTPSLLELIDEYAGRARHPALQGLGERHEDDEEERSDVELLVDRRHRGAVILAANRIVDECIRDLEHIRRDEVIDPDADLFAWRSFPPRFRVAYDGDFLAKVLVCVVKVAYDLASPAAEMPACVAEEIIVNAICEYAYQLLEEAGVGDASVSLQDLLLDDMDFEVLFDQEMDGFEDDPAMQRSLGMWVPSVADWFTPFNPDRIVHPYAETRATGPRAHDLQHLLVTEDLHVRSEDVGFVDDPAPISRMDPISDVVTLARQAAAQRPPAWVPEISDPEGSYAALIRLAGPPHSGWLTWEPHEGADIVRTDAVIAFRPHRHYPAGTDQPWAVVAMAGGFAMHVPLAAVVSYQPDSAVYEEWSNPRF